MNDISPELAQCRMPWGGGGGGGVKTISHIRGVLTEFILPLDRLISEKINRPRQSEMNVVAIIKGIALPMIEGYGSDCVRW